MNHQQFSPYHNRHIKFTYEPPDGPREELSGVVLDIIKYNKKKTPTEYICIKSEELKQWQVADESGDGKIISQLQRIIDINYISSAECIYTS